MGSKLYGERITMQTFKKFEIANQKVGSALEWVGIIAIMAMILITCANVITSKIFVRPIFGALDIIEQAQLIAITFAASITLLKGQHVAVEFFVSKLSKRMQKIIEVLINLLGLFFFITLTWRLIWYAYVMQMGNEVTPTARIPLCPFTYAAAFALIPACFVYLYKLLESIVRLIKNDT